METVTLSVKGMSCMGCVKSVKKVLEPIAGVQGVEVSLEDARATIRYEPGQAVPEQFKAAIRDAGYEVA